VLSEFWKEVIHFFITLIFTLLFVPIIPLLGVYLDRKVLALMQDRLGPTHYGPWGLLQTPLDMIKLLSKEDITAAATDKVIFTVAPMMFLGPIIAAFVVLPFSPYLTVSALGTGIVYLVAFSSLDVIGVLMAGWGSNNKYSLIGGFRSAAQMISYELPLVLALMGVIMMTSVLATGGVGTISLTDIINAQLRPPWLWFIFIQPLGALIYYTCGLAETNRAPFDLPEAESELVAGYLTEYSGIRWALFFLGEYANMVIVSCIAVTLFLGGWSGPGANEGFWVSVLGDFWGAVVFNLFAVLWFQVKLWMLILVFVWVRATLPRLRADQLMQYAWLILIPITLLNILVTGFLLLIVPEVVGNITLLEVPLQVWVAGAFNWLLFVVYIFVLGRIVGAAPLGKMPRWAKARAAVGARSKASATLPAQPQPQPTALARK
jgi:NADH-quinone oxidoreductase subunit H